MTETQNSSLAAEPLSAHDVVAAGRDFAELALSEAGLFWNEFRPKEGTCRLYHWRGRSARCLTPANFSVRSRVYEYGGGAFCASADAVYFVNETDQQIYRRRLEGRGKPRLLSRGGCHYGGLAWHHGQVLAVEETPGTPYPTHRLVALDDTSGELRVLAEGADFYAAGTLSPDGQRLAWVEWDRPELPWTRTRLMCAERGADGAWQPANCVAGSSTHESLQQPRFDARGRLCCLSDRNGFWQPWAESAQGWAPLPCQQADHASAPWQLGASSWQPLPDGGYVASWFEDGFGILGAVDDQGTLKQFTSDYTRFRGVAADAEQVYAIAASPLLPPAVIAIDRASGKVKVLAGDQALLPISQISQPTPFTYSSGDGQAHGFFYPAQPLHGDQQQKPPLLVFAHGGPTSACYPVLDPRIQFWCQRGFAVADLNYRGSSSYGRAYRMALKHNWGVIDVEDAGNALTWLREQGWVDDRRAFIRGSSAGGYTTLCALAFLDLFSGGASLYGVSDPATLARETHKFEADYLDWLIGDPERDAQRYAARTPLLHAEQITAPVIFFQGELDTVVVPEQTASMVASLEANGVPVQVYYYPGERHGFRQAQNLAHALEHEWLFYQGLL
ncbi:S9 family peptidase [Pseudomonas sp. RIT-PI-S]|uniref:S9 family peptidase n=1 Tax=Pseudomonas sp. RIT-PI-S TaxID=3035295 RepID=UPI0021D80214|nr:S9 family peptidase [Pseudomonas sp. RIT-PI-S]